MKVRIEIDTQTFVRFWLVVIGFAVVAFALYSARTALVIIMAALFLALALSKPVTKLAQLMPGNSRVASTAVAFLLTVVFLGGFIVVIVPPVIEQTVRVADTVPYLIESAKDQWYFANEIVQRYHLQPQVDSTISSFNSNLSSWLANAGTSIFSSLGSVFNFLAAAFLTLVLTFLMLVEGPKWMRTLWSTYQDSDKLEYHKSVVTRMHAVVTGYVTGQLAVSGVGALSAGLVVFALSFFFPAVPMNLALPTIAVAFIFSLIPMFGATIAGVLITLLLAITDLSAAIIFAIFFVVYQQIENNFIGPTIQSKTVELSALAVLVAVTIGLYVFGIIGGIISIPIAGCIKVLLEDHYDRRKRMHSAKSKKPLHKLAKKLQEETA